MVLLAVVLGVVGFFIADLLPFEPELRTKGRATVGITMLVATLWLTSAIPVGAASLVPIVLFQNAQARSVEKSQ